MSSYYTNLLTNLQCITQRDLVIFHEMMHHVLVDVRNHKHITWPVELFCLWKDAHKAPYQRQLEAYKEIIESFMFSNDSPPLAIKKHGN